jgi:hypothetical protein
MKQELTPNLPGQSDRLATIWSIIEGRKTFPAMIVVTSATRAEDTESIARGLAQAAHSVGLRTGHLRLAAGDGESGVPAHYAELSIASRGSRREAFDAALAEWLTMYDVVIIDAGILGFDGLGAHVARVGHGVIVAVCDRRRAVSADRNLVRLLSDLQTPIIGVVMTARRGKAPNIRLSRDPSRLKAATQY